MTGYFRDPSCSIFGNLNHDAEQGGGIRYSVNPDNKIMTDCAYLNLMNDANWYAGGFQWNIEAFWYVDGGLSTNQLNWSSQVFNLDANGNMSVSKFGWTVTRGTNNVSVITQ